MPQTAFIIQVRQAESCVADLQERFDGSSKLGAPAHITFQVPFMSPELIAPEVAEPGASGALAGNAGV